MIGWDFLIFWQIGDAVLQGTNPYSIEFSRYPPATTLFFAIFALLPYVVAYASWTGLSLVLLIDTLRRMKQGKWICLWIFYTPIVFNLLTGQIDILFLWLAVWLTSGGRKALAAGVLMTLKPQLAAVILPWFLLKWFFQHRRILYEWLGATAVLHLIPLVLDSTIYGKWFTSLSGVAEMKLPLSSGVFSLTILTIPIWILVFIGIIVVVWGLFRDELTSRAAQLLGFPLTIWYEDVLLTGSIPAWFLVPYSWAAFTLAYFLKSNLPLATIPLAVLIWRFVKKEISPRAT